MSFPAITELVPHAAPMVALEELVEFREGFARGRMTIRPEHPFVRNGEVQAVCALEYMAQGVAACLGMDAYTGGVGIRVGMVIACRELLLERDVLPVGTELWIEAECVRGSDYSSHFDTRLTDADGAPIASATMTLVHGEAPPE